jgi:UDPglucose 6-dehydrogenase
MRLQVRKALHDSLHKVEYKMVYCTDEYDAAQDTDAMVIVTEWNQFRSLDLAKIKGLMRDNYFFDFRNVYDRSEVEELGFIYEGVGR